MPSVLRKKSYGSVKTFWLDRQLALDRALEAARRLAARDEVVKVGIFGSIACGNAAPGSDLDVLIVLSESQLRAVERAEPYQSFFDDVGLATDIFCFTAEEAARSSFFARNASDALWVESTPMKINRARP